MLSQIVTQSTANVSPLFAFDHSPNSTMGWYVGVICELIYKIRAETATFQEEPIQFLDYWSYSQVINRHGIDHAG